MSRDTKWNRRNNNNSRNQTPTRERGGDRDRGNSASSSGDDDLPPSLPSTPTTLSSSSTNFNEWENIKLGPDIDLLQDSISGGCTIIPYNISIEEWTSGAVILPQVNFKITQQLPSDIYERAKLLTQLCKTPVLKSVFSGGDFNNIFMAELDEKYICLTAITTGYRMQANQLLNLITQYGKTPYGNGIIFRFERLGNGNYKYHPVGKKELVLLLNKLLYQKMVEAVKKDKLIRQHYWESDPECTEGIKLFGNDVDVENVEKWALDTKLMALQYKIHKCNRVKIHQKQTCPFFHSLADARRSPELYHYSEKRCTQGFEECFNGIHCTLSHNEFEHFYHPSFLRHSDCMHWKQTGKCKGPLCSFYHPEEMTPPIGKENPQLPYPLPPSISNPPSSITRHAVSNPSLSNSSSAIANQRGIFSPDPRRLNSPDLRRSTPSDNFYNSSSNPNMESNSTPNLYISSPLSSSSNQVFHPPNNQASNEFMRLRSSGNTIENYTQQPSNLDFRASGNEINNYPIHDNHNFYQNPNENYGNSMNYASGMGLGGNTPTGSPLISARMMGNHGIHDSPRTQPQSSLHKSTNTLENNNLPFNPSNLRGSTATLTLNQPIPSNNNNPPQNRLKSSTGSTMDLLRTSGSGNVPSSTPTSSVRTSSTIDLLRNSNSSLEFNNNNIHPASPGDPSGYYDHHFMDYRNQPSPMSPMVTSNFNRLHPNSNNGGVQSSPLSELSFTSSNTPTGAISLTNSMNQQSMYPQNTNYGPNAPLSGDLMYIYPSDQLKNNQHDYFNIFHNNFSELIVNQEIHYSAPGGVNYLAINQLTDSSQHIQTENENISLLAPHEFKFNNLFLQQSENICLEILSSYVSLILIQIFGEQWKNQLNLLLMQLLSSKPSQNPNSQNDRIVFSWNFENLQKIILNIQDNHKNLLFTFPNCKSNDFYEFFKNHEMKDSHFTMEQFKLEVHLIEIIRYESIHFNYLEIEILISKFYEFLNKNYQNSPITMESILYGSHFWNLFKLNQFQRRNFNLSNHTTPIQSPSPRGNSSTAQTSASGSLLSSNSSLKHILIILGNLPISNYLKKLNESIFLCHLPWNFVFDFNENENSILKQTMNSYLLNNYSKTIQLLNHRGEFVTAASLHDSSNEHINKNLHSNSANHNKKIKLNENQLYWMKMLEKYKNEDEEKYSKSTIGGNQDLFLFHLLEQLKSEFNEMISFTQDNNKPGTSGRSLKQNGKEKGSELNKKLSIECTILMYDEEYIFNHSLNKHLNHFINFLYRYPEIDCQFSIFTDCKENNIYSYFSEDKIQRSVHFTSFHQLSWGFQQLVDIESIQILLPSSPSSSSASALPDSTTPATEDDDLPPAISLPTRETKKKEGELNKGIKTSNISLFYHEISEYFQILFRGIEKYNFEEYNQLTLNWLEGNPIEWKLIHSKKHSPPKSKEFQPIYKEIREKIIKNTNKITEIEVNYENDMEGDKLVREIVWELHREYPCIIYSFYAELNSFDYDKISVSLKKIYSITKLPIVLLVDEKIELSTIYSIFLTIHIDFPLIFIYSKNKNYQNPQKKQIKLKTYYERKKNRRNNRKLEQEGEKTNSKTENEEIPIEYFQFELNKEKTKQENEEMENYLFNLLESQLNIENNGSSEATGRERSNGEDSLEESIKLEKQIKIIEITEQLNDLKANYDIKLNLFIFSSLFNLQNPENIKNFIENKLNFIFSENLTEENTRTLSILAFISFIFTFSEQSIELSEVLKFYSIYSKENASQEPLDTSYLEFEFFQLLKEKFKDILLINHSNNQIRVINKSIAFEILFYCSNRLNISLSQIAIQYIDIIFSQSSSNVPSTSSSIENSPKPSTPSPPPQPNKPHGDDEPPGVGIHSSNQSDNDGPPGLVVSTSPTPGSSLIPSKDESGAPPGLSTSPPGGPPGIQAAAAGGPPGLASATLPTTGGIYHPVLSDKIYTQMHRIFYLIEDDLNKFPEIFRLLTEVESLSIFQYLDDLIENVHSACHLARYLWTRGDQDELSSKKINNLMNIAYDRCKTLIDQYYYHLLHGIMFQTMFKHYIAATDPTKSSQIFPIINDFHKRACSNFYTARGKIFSFRNNYSTDLLVLPYQLELEIRQQFLQYYLESTLSIADQQNFQFTNYQLISKDCPSSLEDSRSISIELLHKYEIFTNFKNDRKMLDYYFRKNRNSFIKISLYKIKEIKNKLSPLFGKGQLEFDYLIPLCSSSENKYSYEIRRMCIWNLVEQLKQDSKLANWNDPSKYIQLALKFIIDLNIVQTRDSYSYRDFDMVSWFLLIRKQFSLNSDENQPAKPSNATILTISKSILPTLTNWCLNTRKLNNNHPIIANYYRYISLFIQYIQFCQIHPLPSDEKQAKYQKKETLLKSLRTCEDLLNEYNYPTELREFSHEFLCFSSEIHHLLPSDVYLFHPQVFANLANHLLTLNGIYIESNQRKFVLYENIMIPFSDNHFNLPPPPPLPVYSASSPPVPLSFSIMFSWSSPKAFNVKLI